MMETEKIGRMMLALADQLEATVKEARISAKFFLKK
jgi:hypothetical protein